ncbi:hypothetical protein Hdeb2414_s0070g00772861 [Helianthus debilis subsp. tardiflorus]
MVLSAVISAAHVIGFGSRLSISPQIPCITIQKSSRGRPFCLNSLALTCRSKVCNLSFPLLYVTTRASHSVFAVGNSVRLLASEGSMFWMSQENTTRILAHRQSDARSKEIKIRYTSKLERKVKTLQNKAKNAL